MLNIEIKGVQFSNKGAELMLLSILEQLDKELVDYQITLSPGRLLPYTLRAKLGAWQKLSFRRGGFDLTGVFCHIPKKIRDFLKRYGIVTEKDVDIILDASGFAYGEQWGSKSLIYTAKEVTRFKKKGKKYIFLPQAFGPFQSKAVQKLATNIFLTADLVFPRDVNSYQEIVNLSACLSHNHNIKQAPDFTCLLEPKTLPKRKNGSKKTICLIPNNKMFSKFNHEKANSDRQQYLNFFIQTGLFYQKKGWQVVLLNHEGNEDELICQKISQKLSVDDDITIYQNLSAIDIKALIGTMDAVFSSRFHGCVSALTQGVPCISTSWSHKYQMLFEEYGMSDNVFDFKMNEVELIDKLVLFNETLDSQKQQALECALDVKQQTKKMWQQVFSMIHEK